MQLAIFGILAPFGANAAGWIFTEMGRQPWVVYPNPNPSGVDGVWMMTWRGVSNGVGPGTVDHVTGLLQDPDVAAVLLEGPAGIGKRALADVLLQLHQLHKVRGLQEDFPEPWLHIQPSAYLFHWIPSLKMFRKILNCGNQKLLHKQRLRIK